MKTMVILTIGNHNHHLAYFSSSLPISPLLKPREELEGKESTLGKQFTQASDSTDLHSRPKTLPPRHWHHTLSRNNSSLVLPFGKATSSIVFLVPGFGCEIQIREIKEYSLIILAFKKQPCKTLPAMNFLHLSICLSSLSVTCHFCTMYLMNILVSVPNGEAECFYIYFQTNQSTLLLLIFNKISGGERK